MADKTPKRLRLKKLLELSLVDDPANQHAHVTIHKRRGDDPADYAALPVAIVKAASSPSAKTFDQILAEAEAERRRWEASEKLYPLFSALRQSLENIAGDAAVDQKGKAAKIKESVTAFLGAVKTALPDVEAEIAKALRADPVIAEVLADKAAGGLGDSEENGMDKDLKIAELTKSVEDLTKKLEAETSALAIAKAALKKSESEVTALKAAEEIAKSDETLTVDGITVRKSKVDPDLFAVIKAQAERTEITEFEKMAASGDFARLPLTPVEKAKALRAVHKMAEADRNAVLTLLKAGNSAMGSVLRVVGAGGDVPAGSAQEKFDKAVGDFAKSKNMDKDAAADAFLKTDEGRALYAEIDAEHRKRAKEAA